MGFPIRADATSSRAKWRSPLFDESPLVELAQADPTAKLFRWSWRTWMSSSSDTEHHFHTLKHSICVLLWHETHDLNVIQDHVGHHSSSSTLVYLRADAAQKAQTTIAGMSFGAALWRRTRRCRGRL